VSSGVSLTVWLLTIAGFVAVVVLDLVLVSRRRTEVTTRSAVRWLAGYVALAIAFGAALLWWGPAASGGEFFAGYVTEYSLSVDNLFVFLVVITRMRVPVVAQDRVLLIGIVLSMVLRATFILAGAAAISAASWTFYVLGAFLLYTALTLALEREDDPDDHTDHRLVVLLRRVLPLTDDYAGTRFTVRGPRGRMFTPLVLAVAAIAIANVVFAVDSIPAIFGLTTNPYVVLTANGFALLGLRQLYFVVEMLLSRLRYLKIGLVVILATIGVKLILEAMVATHVDHIGPWHVHEISTSTSLVAIVIVLATVTVTSIRAAEPEPVPVDRPE
jgi:TerC family integral membrane protein